MANVSYVNSLAERRMKFSSSVTVEAVSQSDLFNSISVYMPLSFAAANIVDFDGSGVDKNTPALLACTVDNYKDELKGDLLDQITPIFRDDTNSDAVLYVIVFEDVDTVPTMWEIGTKSISFEPLTNAFKALYFISFIKLLFDPSYNGEDVVVPGTIATAGLTFTNGGAVERTLAAGNYTFNDGTKDWYFAIAAAQAVAAGASFTPVAASATTSGASGLSVGSNILPSSVSPVVNADFTITVATLVQGTAPSTRASKYFDHALALAYLAKSDTKLSTFWPIVRVDITKAKLPVDTNKCWCRSKTDAEQKAAMTSLVTGDRAKYFWAALVLMNAQRVFVGVDCENRNMMAVILNAWFAEKNSSGEYVGNKLSMLRISSQKCFGLPSIIDSNYNANDDWLDEFDKMNIGYFASISASANGDSYLSACRDVNGFPINAWFIAKFADYKSGQDCANFITDKGTLTDPVLTDELAYKKIQNIAIGNVAMFAGTRRIRDIVPKFPAFEVARVSANALQASSAWSASYVDDLDTVTISGGITA